MPMGVNFGGALSPVLTGYCSRGHITTIRGEDVAHIWLAAEQRVPAWYQHNPIDDTTLIHGNSRF